MTVTRMLAKRYPVPGCCKFDDDLLHFGKMKRRIMRRREKEQFKHWVWLELGECDPDPYWLDDPYWHGGWEHELGPMSGISCS